MPPKSRTTTAPADNPATRDTAFQRAEVGVHIAAWSMQRRRLAGSSLFHPAGKEYPNIADRLERLQLPRLTSARFEAPLEVHKAIKEKVQKAAETGYAVMGRFVDILVAVDRGMVRQIQQIEADVERFSRDKDRR